MWNESISKVFSRSTIPQLICILELNCKVIVRNRNFFLHIYISLIRLVYTSLNSSGSLHFSLSHVFFVASIYSNRYRFSFDSNSIWCISTRRNKANVWNSITMRQWNGCHLFHMHEIFRYKALKLWINGYVWSGTILSNDSHEYQQHCLCLLLVLILISSNCSLFLYLSFSLHSIDKSRRIHFYTINLKEFPFSQTNWEQSLISWE